MARMPLFDIKRYAIQIEFFRKFTITFIMAFNMCNNIFSDIWMFDVIDYFVYTSNTVIILLA